MTTSLLKLTGNILYLIGALMVALPFIAIVASAGMVLLAGYVFLLTPVVGAILVAVGKGMIKNTARLEIENKANQELLDRYTRDITDKNDPTK